MAAVVPWFRRENFHQEGRAIGPAPVPLIAIFVTRADAAGVLGVRRVRGEEPSRCVAGLYPGLSPAKFTGKL
jgi:hypothetical protein